MYMHDYVSQTAAGAPKSSVRSLLRAMCSQGGRTAHAHGQAHRFNPEETSEAGKKGRASVVTDEADMATIGQSGGKAKKEGLPREASRPRPS